MTCKVLATLEKHGMLRDVSTVCVGVSGGADSVALLHLLCRLRETFRLSLRVVHVNHHLRGEEADRDAAFVRALCEGLGVPCVVCDYDVAAIAAERKLSVETCGRELRYAAFRAQGCDAIAVAHTRSDSIESSLFHLARGTSLRGAAGIPPKNGDVIRPLIDCTRDEVEAYVAENGLPFMTDRTNAEDVYTRNYIRHTVTAPLKERFPAFESGYARFMENAAIAQSFLDAAAKETLEQAKTETGWRLSPLQQAHPAVLQCCVQSLLSSVMEKQVEETHIRLCCRALQDGHGKVEIAAGQYFTVHQGSVFFSRKTVREFWSVPVERPSLRAAGPHGIYQITELSGEARLQADRRHRIDPKKAQGRLCLRARKPGDVFHSPVRKQSKTLKKLFNEMKLSAPERAACAVLTADEAIVWVEGVGVDAAFQADDTADPVWIIRKERNSAPHVE